MGISAGDVYGDLILRAGQYFDTLRKADKEMGGFVRKLKSHGVDMEKMGKTLTKTITLPVTGLATAAAGVVAAFGWKRLVGLDTAQAQLKGLGYTMEDVERISKQVSNAVQGTTMTMAEGTSVATGALAAGVKEGEQLEKYIKLVGSAAVGAKRDVGDMAMIFNRVQGAGRLMTQELNMIEMGMPGFAMAMSNALGVSQAEFRKMVTDGKISSQQFLKVMEDFAGGMADAYADSWEGMVSNTKANIGIIGQHLLGGVFAKSKESIAEFLELLRSDAARKWAQETGQKLGEAFVKLIEGIKRLVSWWLGLSDTTKKVIGVIGGVIVVLGPMLTLIVKISNMFTILKTGAALLGPAIGALANPITLIIALFAALVAAGVLIAKNWEGIKEVAGQVWGSIQNTISDRINKIKTTWAEMNDFVKLAIIGLVTGPIGLLIAGVIQIARNHELIKGKIISAWNSIISFFSSIPEKMKALGRFIIEGLIAGLKNGIAMVRQVVVNIANTIINTFKRLVGIYSRSQLFYEFGGYIDEGLADGIKDGSGKVIDQVQALIDGIKQTIDKNMDMLNRLGDALVDSLRKRNEEMEREQLKALDREIDNARKASDEKIKIYDKEYTEKLKLIDEEAYRAIKALEDEIDGIDKLTDKEEKRLRDQAHRKRLHELKDRLAEAKTAEDRAKIREEIEETVANYERTLLLESRREQKEALRDEIQDIRDSAQEKRDELKQELEDKKLAEKELLEAVIDGLENERTEVVEHYKKLNEKEVLEAEARKLMIEKNNDEIIGLLKTYNPKWQDAGQSFADALINGLNSEKQSMEEAIKNLFDFQDTVEERIEALDRLEQKLDALQSAESKGGGGGKIGELTDLLGGLGDDLDEIDPKLDEFGNKVGEVTAKTVEGFLEMERQTRQALYTMAWRGETVTEEMKNAIIDNVEEMAGAVIEAMEQEKKDSLEILEEKLDMTTELSEEEKDNILRITAERHDKEIQTIQDSKDRIEEILEDALEKNTKITEDEKKEIEGILENLKNRSIFHMTESQIKQEEILKDLRDNATKLSREMASEIIKESIRRKRETIKEANEEYNKTMEIVRALREDGSDEAIELADNMIREAERQRKETIEKAEEMHNGVLEEVKAQGKSVTRQLDLDSGEIKNIWTKLRDWFKRNPITRVIKTSVEGSTGGGTGGGGASSYAQGTSYHPGGLAWVGEMGRELIDLPNAARVYSHQKSMQMMTSKMEHSGVITVMGVNNQEETVGVVDIWMDEMRREVRL